MLAENAAARPGRRLKQTLAGALVSLIDGRIRVEPAPPRRRRAGLKRNPSSLLIRRSILAALTTPENTRSQRHYLNGNRAKMR